ncbi:hypothetical protein FGSG_12898 [Fusarium graminearum PH-1]|uniref:Chromosome 3, complete genome n=1 Tax=Gibberella zeae (strain ATCC MYA-4620 / CBS 123657 / FGSC 9075 / NRRL 31084 / PH-1) TaxID=229533 RepID=I1S7S3_GIBZE|nr:hypothetical protein FGSG_12898 [Fusarium graminearum PH-1]ESU12330.1 hypothetical protein FGSG_12898 [Fusarium graminearum PH-1]CEF88447.1 unnamed protein product [Fusarium graminearum]|eukprot:XP_011324906.1 hypothetical protein FGSG_12898 [Fusarium graminearum PH-1]
MKEIVVIYCYGGDGSISKDLKRGWVQAVRLLVKRANRALQIGDVHGAILLIVLCWVEKTRHNVNSFGGKRGYGRPSTEASGEENETYDLFAMDMLNPLT